MSVHFTIPWAQGMESIPSGGGYIPSYPGTYPGMEHPRISNPRFAQGAVRLGSVKKRGEIPSWYDANRPSLSPTKRKFEVVHTTNHELIYIHIYIYIYI